MIDRGSGGMRRREIFEEKASERNETQGMEGSGWMKKRKRKREARERELRRGV